MSDPDPSPLRSIVVGTRGSELALVQAAATERLLATAFPGISLRREVIRTTGDRRTDVALAEVAKAEGTFDKGVFIKELEEALDEGRIDVAVHSLKDLPTVLDARFCLAAVLERAPVRDALVTRDGATLAELPAGSRVGTSSVRRARQVNFLRPDLEVIDLRGNVPTRLRKLAEEGRYDGILLAEAGLVRLGFLAAVGAEDGGAEGLVGFPGLAVRRLDEAGFFPAAGQGAIALEVRAGDDDARRLAEAIGDADTWRRITAEREFLRLLDGGCHTPVGVHSRLEDGVIHLAARVFPESAGPPCAGAVRGVDPHAVAAELYQSLT